MSWLRNLFISLMLSHSLFGPIKANADIHINNVPQPLKGKINDHLKSVDLPCDSPRSAANRILRQSDAELTQALQALGYFNAHFQRKLSFEPKCWHIRYEISLGEPLSVRHANIEISGAAAQQKEFHSLLDKYPIKPGETFNNDSYEALKLAIQTRGTRLGYLDAQSLEQRVDIYPHLNVADITLRWDSGSRYRFGNLQVEQRVLKESLFKDLLSVQPGQPYNLSILQNDRIRLNESGYFDLVEITPLLASKNNGTVPIQVLATPGPTSSYEVGAGFSTDTGPRLRGSYTRHRINDAGHKGGASLLLSPVLNKLNLNYSLPWRDPRTDSLRADLSYLDEDNDSLQSKRWESSFTDNMLLDSGWTQSLSLTLSSENSTVANQRDSSLHLVPGISWSKLSADNLTYPNKGYSLAFALLGSSEQVVSDSSFLQIQSSAKWVTSLPLKLRLLVRGELGYSLVDSIEDLPSSRRFFTGGDNSIRGYDYQSLGPLENNEVIGGKHKAIASLELERPIYKKWAIATFVDGGNAWNDHFDPVTGVGLGLRWHSPIGPLRFDIAVPLDDDDNNFRIHFNFGSQL